MNRPQLPAPVAPLRRKLQANQVFPALAAPCQPKVRQNRRNLQPQQNQGHLQLQHQQFQAVPAHLPLTPHIGMLVRMNIEHKGS